MVFEWILLCAFAFKSIPLPLCMCVFVSKEKKIDQSEREDRFEKTNQLYNELPLAESGLFN